MRVCELPPRESGEAKLAWGHFKDLHGESKKQRDIVAPCNMRVSFESRYGTWTLPRFVSSPRALMTFPRANRPCVLQLDQSVSQYDIVTSVGGIYMNLLCVIGEFLNQDPIHCTGISNIKI